MRYASFSDFWPYYISEHRDPKSRMLHFCGTGGFLLNALFCTYTNPVSMPIAIVLTAFLVRLQFAAEKDGAAFATLIASIIMLCVGGGIQVLAGVVFAYAAAWVGHFKIEHNRPATFTYPLWSFSGDFRMFGHMLRGQLWHGDGTDIAGPAYTPEERAAARAAQVEAT